MEKHDSRNVLLSVLGVAILVVAVVGISYAVFTFAQNGTKNNAVTTGTISMTYTESETNVIAINNAMPTTDATGVTLTDSFDFTVSSTITGDAKVNYEVRARNVALTTDEISNGKVALSPENVKLYLEKETSGSYASTLESGVDIPTFAINSETSLTNPSVDTNTMLLYKGSFTNTTAASNTYSENFKLRMWLKDGTTVDTTAKTFKVKVDVYASVDSIR